jgi:hypothetical protein
MLNDVYDLEFGATFKTFEFDSHGPKGVIRKMVQYSETNLKDYFNLGFGDKNIQTNDIDDLVVTNNGDSQKVLATVASTLFSFTDIYPDAYVLATGSTLPRTRLYRMGISNNLEHVEQFFHVYGLKNNEWHRFVKEVRYDAFLVKRKK